MSKSRLVIAAAAAAAALLSACAGDQRQPATQNPPPAAMAPDEVVDDLEERTFRFFWETANPDNGLVPDRFPTPSFSSIAAIGFGLTAYGVGVERGYVSREEARDRVLTTLRFLDKAPSGPDPAGMTGYKGFFYHFLDMKTGKRFKDVELSTVDTTLLLGGVLFAQSYFDQDDPAEAEIRSLAEEIYGRVDWPWAQTRPPAISMGWKPESGFLAYDWVGYNEAMLVYILALGSPTHPVEPAAWTAWSANYDKSWRESYGQEHLHFPPLFGHQYSQVWVDFRGIKDPYMQQHGIDYFENSRRATLAQRAYAAANPDGWKGYSEDIWGLTACDGPGDLEHEYGGKRRVFRGYSARGMASYDDGTLAPTAAASSIAFAPEIAIPAMVEMRRLYGEQIYSTYGFVDAFNPSFDFDVPVTSGRVVRGFGWVDEDYLGIDQGPIVAMIENHRSELVWKVMQKNPHIRLGLTRAGFSGGWLEAVK
ncbi:MAG TPA: glucoamylase family protein [Kofleriaceae bacterium]|nr:glucoamylase family protein [Kofleriaceae bacterium]